MDRINGAFRSDCDVSRQGFCLMLRGILSAAIGGIIAGLTVHYFLKRVERR